MSLFQRGDFTLSSGVKSQWKIECDDATDEDFATWALMVYEKTLANPFLDFHSVIPVPKGQSKSSIDNALRFAKALVPYCKLYGKNVLIVDDVYTTGESLRKYRDSLVSTGKFPITNFLGIVVFAREQLASQDRNWVKPLFQMG